MVLYEKEDVSQSGVALCDENNFIQAFLEKPAPGQTTGRWVNAGVYLMQPELLDLIPEGPCDFGHTVIPNYLARGKRILGVKTPDRVYSVDTPLLLRETRERFPGP
jgi:NDP-sugar pyrophosphorylase family protein